MPSTVNIGPKHEQLGLVPTQTPGPISIGSENGPAAASQVAAADQQPSMAETVLSIRKEVRRRNKAHLAFVAAQPCLVCQRSPCDAHSLKFAQPRSLGRKVSDEFTCHCAEIIFVICVATKRRGGPIFK
jgi:hypothetical protein